MGSADESRKDLRLIQVDLIDPNPDNPRLVFRQSELEDLTASIRKLGVQVPISVYRKDGRYVLIDGERRWRCSRKLNLSKIPAIIQDEPDPLSNLLMMFNIHALREQWDLLTIAIKLPKIIKMIEQKSGVRPTESMVAEETGLSRGLIRRCKLLMDMPDRFKDLLMEELGKPVAQQKLSEDFFIEMEKALKSARNAMPMAIQDVDEVRNVLLQKYRDGVIRNVLDLRKIPKIARASKVDADPKQARAALKSLFTPNDVSVVDAFESSVAHAYAERDTLARVSKLSETLLSLEEDELDEHLKNALSSLAQSISRILEGEEA